MLFRSDRRFFQQAEKNVDRSCSGLGLGLTVARRMAQLIGGTVQITSAPGAGTSVNMRFPSQATPVIAPVTEQRRYG